MHGEAFEEGAWGLLNFLAAVEGSSPTPLPTLPIGLSCVGICIAVAAFTVALRNFRLSRFPHVRFVFNIYYSQSVENPKGAHYFDVEVESWGLPIYDAKVSLVADYRLGFDSDMGTYSIGLSPVGTLPNPLNPGQVVKFRTTQEFIQSSNHSSVKEETRKWGFGDLPPERVTLVIYGSGGREVRRVTSEFFGTGFFGFDSVRKETFSQRWTKHQSKVRRYTGVALLDRVVGRRLRPLLHRFRLNRAHAKYMRSVLKRS